MPDYLPGTDTPVMTGPEAIQYLRLNVITKPDGAEQPREMADAMKSLDHLVRTRRICVSSR